MATATEIRLAPSNIPSFGMFADRDDLPPTLVGESSASNALDEVVMDVDLDEAAAATFDPAEAYRLATLCKEAHNLLTIQQPDFDPARAYTATEILDLPMTTVRIADDLHDLPRRKSRGGRNLLAAAIAGIMYPSHEGSLAPLIRYDADRVHIRAWAALQRKYDILAATKRNGHFHPAIYAAQQKRSGPPIVPGVPAYRIAAQGLWDPVKHPISLRGVKALPMPVRIADADDLAPFFGHLALGGTHELDESNADQAGSALEDGKGEPFYGTKGAEFRKGVVYEDGRMDLCKMVVGPDHIGALMEALRTNEFVRHFLLGNNIIGPVGAREIARFVDEFPNRMDTWYLAGNCIDGEAFKILVDAWVRNKSAATNIWLKRNPLGRNAAEDVFRLITELKDLRTLDLDQTELGDEGIAELFTRLAQYGGGAVGLKHIYLNGVGVGPKGAYAIASFLRSRGCRLTSLYLSCNPLGNEGIITLTKGITRHDRLKRLSLQSVGVGSEGVTVLANGLTPHESISMLDLGQAYATQDLGQAYNYITDDAVPALDRLLHQNTHLEYLNLGHVAISPAGLRALDEALLRPLHYNLKTLLFYAAESILIDTEVKEPIFVPATDVAIADPASWMAPSSEDRARARRVRAELAGNVRRKYDYEMTYGKFLDEEKRWLINDQTDVRKIDSVYRNRDMGLARRRLMTLVKDWEEGDDTIERVMNAQGPFCTARRH